MKRFIMMLLIGTLLLSVTACGGTDDTGKENTKTPIAEEQGDSGDKIKADITMDDVLNHAVTPEEDFLYMDNGENSVMISDYLGDDQIVVIPEKIAGKDVTSIGSYSFANDTLVKGVRVADTVVVIEDFAFAMNPHIEYVHLGKGVQTLGEAVFMDCESIKEVILSDCVKEIGKYSFSGVSVLSNIELPDSLEMIDDLAFNWLSKDFIIVGSSGSLAEEYASEKGFVFQAK